MPSAYSFQPGDDEAHSFQVTFNAVGTQSLTATDAASHSNTATGFHIILPPIGPVTHFGVYIKETDTSYAPPVGPTTLSYGPLAGAPDNATVVALNAYNQAVPPADTVGTVHFTSTDGSAHLVQRCRDFQAPNDGEYQFTVTFSTPWPADLDRHRYKDELITGSAVTNVNPAPVATHLLVVWRKNVTIGVPVNVIVEAMGTSAIW